MKVLVIGSGGREHSLAWALSESSVVAELVFAPGNPGMASLGRCFPVGAEDVRGVRNLAVSENVDLAIVGPEAPLVAGASDALRQTGIPSFGPVASWARLEGSKSFAKSLMTGHGIPTASYAEFEASDEAIAYAEKVAPPIVVKADGLAAGKGVTVCGDAAGARRAILAAMEERRFGEAGRKVLIEEYLEGEELSMLAFCDGKTLLPMEPARDYKRAYDGDRGPNTGGMGSYSPVSSYTPEVHRRILSEIFDPLAEIIQSSEDQYVGVIYAGLMLTEAGPKVVEFNCRFGDPETQALLPRLVSDFGEIVIACTEGSLAGVTLEWSKKACVSVVAASGDYPETYETGFPIIGLEELSSAEDVFVFHAGTGTQGETIVSAGGRVLNVSGLGETKEAARRCAYGALGKISFEGMRFRSDIGEAVAEKG